MFVFHRVDGAGGVVSLETIQNAKVIMSGRSVCVCVCVCVCLHRGEVGEGGAGLRELSLAGSRACQEQVGCRGFVFPA